MVKTFDNINLLPNQYKEEEEIVIFRVTEKEIEKAFPEIIHIEVQLKEKEEKEGNLIPF